MSPATNQDYLNRLSRVECRDSTYRPTNLPVVFAKAKGSSIWDVEGKEYIDLCAGFGALPLGHASEALLNVAKNYSEDIPMIEHAMGDVYPSEEKILFLETLQSMLPKKYKLGAVALTGGQAVEIALKTAMLATKYSGVIAFDDAYHGLDLGVLPLTARRDFKDPFVNWITDSNVIRLPYGASEESLVEAVKKLGKRGLAAIIVEPIQGRAGVNLPPDAWLQMLAEVAHKNSGLLILDEIFTGIGRIGSISTAEFVDSDISCFGKAIGGGFPISACFAKETIMNAWPHSKGEALHTGTFFGHPFSAAVGRQTLLKIRELKLDQNSLDLGLRVIERIKSESRLQQHIKSVRGQGLFVGIEFFKIGRAIHLMDELREDGIIVLPSGNSGSVLSLTPALNIPESILLGAVDVIIKRILRQN